MYSKYVSNTKIYFPPEPKTNTQQHNWKKSSSSPRTVSVFWEKQYSKMQLRQQRINPAMLGKGSGLELKRTADKCNKRAVAQSVLVKMLCFKWHCCKPIMGLRGAIHVNHLQAPCGAFFRWDLSWREHVNFTYSYVDSTRFWISTCCSYGLQYGST